MPLPSAAAAWSARGELIGATTFHMGSTSTRVPAAVGEELDAGRARGVAVDPEARVDAPPAGRVRRRRRHPHARRPVDADEIHHLAVRPHPGPLDAPHGQGTRGVAGSRGPDAREVEPLFDAARGGGPERSTALPPVGHRVVDEMAPRLPRRPRARAPRSRRARGRRSPPPRPRAALRARAPPDSLANPATLATNPRPAPSTEGACAGNASASDSAGSTGRPPQVAVCTRKTRSAGGTRPASRPGRRANGCCDMIDEAIGAARRRQEPTSA